MAVPTPLTPRVLRFGPFTADLRLGELRKHGTKVRVQEQPFQVLSMLLVRPGDLVTREEFRQRLWPADTYVDFEHGLNAAINRLRERLGDSAEKPRYIETIPRRGYRFIAAVEAEPVPAAPVVSGPQPAASPKHRWWVAVALAVLIVLAAALGLERWLRRAEPVPVHSLAVLPFQNYSGDPGQEYFNDGMTEELISELSHISALRVISRTSIMQYKNSRKSLRDIGRELNVDAVVEGSVERSGSRVRISAQLILARTDTHLWAQSYERDVRDVLALQEDVARAITNEIRVQLTPTEQARLSTVRSVNPEAHEDYLRGVYHISKRTEPDLQKGIRYFQQAIDIQPDYALAYAGLADAFALRGSLLYVALPPREVFPQSKEAALKALQLDDSLSEVHATLGYIGLMYDWDWPRCGVEFQRAIELNPNDAQAHHWYAAYLAAMGRQDQAIREMKRAQELDPLSLIINTNLGLMLYFAHRYDDAVEQYRKTLELEPEFFVARWQLGLAYQQKGMIKEAQAEFQSARSLAPANPIILGSLAETDAARGDRKQARAILSELTQLSTQRFVSPYAIAELNLTLGDREQALFWLNRAVELRDSGLIFLSIDPTFQALHSDPRFQDVLRRMKLSD